MLIAKAIYRLAFVLGLLLIYEPMLRTTSATGRTTRNHEPEIRLILQVSKKIYKVGDPIEITVYLENTSNHSYYVGNNLAGFSTISSLHYIALTTIDANNKEVSEGRGAATSVWDAGTTVIDKLFKSYTQLRPMTIFGVKEMGHIMLSPGQYKIKAAYHEVEALSWSEVERSALQIPVWTQPLTSNTVTIQVVPQSPKLKSSRATSKGRIDQY